MITVICMYLTISGARRDPVARLVDERNKQVIFINCVPFCNYISEIRNWKVDNASRCNSRCNLDVNLWCRWINYSKKIYRHLWHSCRDDITDYESLKPKTKITGSTAANDNTKDVEIAAPLEYGSFRGPLQCG